MNCKSPCGQCTDRYVGCHGVCDKYAEYRVGINESKKRVYTAKKLEHNVGRVLYRHHKKGGAWS